MPVITKSYKTDSPVVKVRMISHGTLTSLDMSESRRFYEEVLGFDVVQVSPVSMVTRKGSDHTYVVVETGKPSTMNMFDHNGIDVETKDAVDAAYTDLVRLQQEYGLSRITKPLDQHGAYSFYFADRDGNWWEILESKDPRGYTLVFNDPGRDLTGRADIDPDDFKHTGDDDYAKTLRKD